MNSVRDRVLNGVLLAIGVCLGLAIADASPLEDWFFRYQALIAGFFAVAAAGLTVAYMLRTDANQQRRHEQLVRVSLRLDRLRARRLALPRIHLMRQYCGDLRSVCLSLVEKLERGQRELSAIDFKAAAEPLRMLDLAVTPAETKPAEELFDAELVVQIAIARKSGQEAAHLCGLR